MPLRDTVEFTHVALGLVPEILDPVDVIMTVCKEMRMIDPEVVKGRDIQHIVATPAVGIDDTVWHNLALYDGDQSGRFSTRDDLGVNLPAPFQ